MNYIIISGSVPVARISINDPNFIKNPDCIYYIDDGKINDLNKYVYDQETNKLIEKT